MKNHIRTHKEGPKKPKSQAWLDSREKMKGRKLNRPKVQRTCPYCRESREYTKCQYVFHINHCILNLHAKKRKGHKVSEETKRKLHDIAMENHYVPPQRNPTEYNGILWDSMWEVYLAQRLDVLGVRYDRPTEGLPYIGQDGREHNYYPDFWLPDYNTYIEVKNMFLFENDPKNLILRKTRNDIIWVTSESQCRNFHLREGGVRNI